MKLVFASNYYNHHQSALCEALHKRIDSFTFVSTSEMRSERKALGYGSESEPPYLLKAHLSKAANEECLKRINDSDVVIIGAAPENMISSRKKRGKLTFRYTERPLRNGSEPLKYIPRFIRWHIRNPMTKPLYLLCASAYAAGDYARFGLYKNRAYKWGYFTETKLYDDLDGLFYKKNRLKILWVARFLPLKHPDTVVEVAKHLKENGYEFDMDFIGAGEMEGVLRRMISDYHLEDCVHLLGTMKPMEVREHMENAGIFLFTSDKREGWGAVLNEAMNSGCAVVASHAIGAVPYLIENEKNGLIYKSGDIDMLCEKVRYLLEHPEKQEALGKRAYETITTLWNAEAAAERLLVLSEHILSGEKYPNIYKSGPCSRAEILSDHWM